MLERPDLANSAIVTALQSAYGIEIQKIAFLPLGADLNSAVYRAETGDGRSYFVKSRRADFDPAAVVVPRLLADLGIEQIIPPLLTQTGALWTGLESFKLILYPFVLGRNGFEVHLTDRQRVEFGAALRRIHAAEIPPSLTAGVRRETFSPRWRQRVRQYLRRVEYETFAEPVAAKLAAFLRAKRDETQDLVGRAEQLARTLVAEPPEFILCHGDIHAWNLLIDPDGTLYIVDWDTLVYAPKERDLMFVGAGLGGRGHSIQEEEALFYRGYGRVRIDPIALAYFRYERIVEDIAVICKQILSSDQGGRDREQGFGFLTSNFMPNGTIALARRSDNTWPGQQD